MDWLEDFKQRYIMDKDIQELKTKKIHGSLNINFCDGIPVNCDLHIHKRFDRQPLKKGEQNV